jgi:tetratricopeptide (TPR) repeat protein
MLRQIVQRAVPRVRSVLSRANKGKVGALFQMKFGGCTMAKLTYNESSYHSFGSRSFHSSSLCFTANLDPEKRRTNIARYLKLGSDKVKSNKLSEALAAYQMVLQYDDLHLEAHQQCGLLLHQLGRNTEATKHLKTAIAMDSQNPEIFLLFARVLMAQDFRDAAYDYMKRAAKVDVDNLTAYKMMAEFEVKTGRLDHALRNLRVAAKLSPEDTDVMIQAGLVELEKQNYDAARDLLTKAVQKPLPGAHRAMSRFHATQKDFVQAIESLKKAQEVNAEDNETDIAFAEVYALTGDKMKAKQHIDNILKRQANNVEALHLLAKMLMEEQNYSRVQELCTKILNTNIKYTAGYQLAGISYLKQLNYANADEKKLRKEALKYLRLAEIADPKDLKTTALLGVVLEQQEEWHPVVKKILDAPRGLLRAAEVLNKQLQDKKWNNILIERAVKTDPSQEIQVKAALQ